jgi:hypothetical protein
MGWFNLLDFMKPLKAGDQVPFKQSGETALVLEIEQPDSLLVEQIDKTTGYVFYRRVPRSRVRKFRRRTRRGNRLRSRWENARSHPHLSMSRQTYYLTFPRQTHRMTRKGPFIRGICDYTPELNQGLSR